MGVRDVTFGGREAGVVCEEMVVEEDITLTFALFVRLIPALACISFRSFHNL